MPSNYLYLKARELQELDRAKEAKSKEAEKRHLELASNYSKEASEAAEEQLKKQTRGAVSNHNS